MNNNIKKQLLSLLLSNFIIISSMHGKTLFDEMIEEMNEMQSRFERKFARLQEETKKGFGSYQLAAQSATISINENKTNNSVEVLIDPLDIKEKKFEATMDQESNTLTIMTPAGSAIVQVDRHFMSVSFNHQIKQESDEKNGKHQVMFNSYAQMAKTVSADIALEQAVIEYDQAEKKLVISIPLRKKPMTKIPVSIKEAPITK